MSIRTFWIVLLFIFSIKLNAQQIIDGYYDPAHKEFFAKANLLNRFNEPYEISTFEDGFATIKLLKTAADRQLEIENNVNGVMVVSENRDRIGLMDSTGRVVLPMRYNKLERLNWNYNKYYKFRVNDSIGIATIDGRELIKLKKWKMDKSVGKYNRCLEEYKNGVSINSTIHRDIVSVKSGDKIGLFSLLKEKYLIPIEFDCVPHPMKECLFYSDGRAEIHINGDAAICNKGSNKVAVNLITCEQSEEFADIQRLESGAFYIRTLDGKKILTQDFKQTEISLPYKIHEVYQNRIIVQLDSLFGLMDSYSRMVIPAIYQDIYFEDHEHVWLKKDGRWALSDYQNNLNTGFDFYDIDQLNEIYFHSFTKFTRVDTSAIENFRFDESLGMSDRTNEVKELACAVNSLRGSRKLYTTYNADRGGTQWTYARMSDGYHVIYTPLNQIEKEAWAMVYYVPDWVSGVSCSFGYQLGNKFGFEKNEIRYEGIVYDSKELCITSSRNCFVRGKNLFCDCTNYKITKDASSTWDKMMPHEEYIIR